MKKHLSVAVSLIGALALTACGQSSADTGDGGANDPIKIGVIVSDTGTYAFAGTVSHVAMDIAAAKVNAGGGVGGRKIELVYTDDGSQTPQALTALGKYAADRDVVAVIGPTATPVAVALGPVATARKIPLIGATVISGAPLKTGPYVFKTSANPSSIMNQLANAAGTELGLKRVAVIYGRDNEGQVEQKNAFEEGFTQAGGQIVTEVGVLNTDTNFSSAAQKVVAAKPDALFVSLTGDASGNAVDQVSQAGLPDDVQLLGTSQSVSPQYLKIGGDATEGTIAGADYDPSLENESNSYFREEYQKKQNMLPDAYAALGYEGVMQLTQALESIDGDITRESIKAAMTTDRSFEGVLGDGKYAIGADRVPTYGVALLQVTNGAYGTFK